MRRVLLLSLLTLALHAATVAQQFRFNTGTPAPMATGSSTSRDFTNPSFVANLTCPGCSVPSGQIGPVNMTPYGQRINLRTVRLRFHRPHNSRQPHRRFVIYGQHLQRGAPQTRQGLR